MAAARVSEDGEDVRTSTLEFEAPGRSASVPIRVMTRKITAQVDGNDYFAQVMVNRVWADLMGRGIVKSRSKVWDRLRVAALGCRLLRGSSGVLDARWQRARG
jgi:hypothetical protein